MGVLEITRHAGRLPTRVELEAVKTKLGTVSDCHIRLSGMEVAPYHAMIEKVDGGHRLWDLGSTYGTTVNGMPVREVLLADGDLVIIGAVHLRYWVFPPARGPQPSPAPVGPLCPRCKRALVAGTYATGGGYRDGATQSLLRCEACALSLIPAKTLRTRYQRDRSLGGTHFERDRRPSGLACPECGHSFEELTLAWESTWVELEECPGCGTVALDDGEGPLLDRLMQEAE